MNYLEVLLIMILCASSSSRGDDWKNTVKCSLTVANRFTNKCKNNTHNLLKNKIRTDISKIRKKTGSVSRDGNQQENDQVQQRTTQFVNTTKPNDPDNANIGVFYTIADTHHFTKQKHDIKKNITEKFSNIDNKPTNLELNNQTSKALLQNIKRQPSTVKQMPTMNKQMLMMKQGNNSSLQTFNPSTKKDYVVEVDDDDDENADGDRNGDNGDDENDDSDDVIDDGDINGDRRTETMPNKRLQSMMTMFKQFLIQRFSGRRRNPLPILDQDEDDPDDPDNNPDNFPDIDNVANQQIVATQQNYLDEGFVSGNRRRLGNKLVLASLKEKQYANNYYLDNTNANVYEKAAAADNSNVQLPLQFTNQPLVNQLHEASEINDRKNDFIDSSRMSYSFSPSQMSEQSRAISNYQQDTPNFQQLLQ